MPRQLGMPATPGNIKRIESEKAKRLAVFEAEKAQAQQQAEVLSKVSLTIAVEVNDQEKLYGAVSETEILEALEPKGKRSIKRRWSLRSLSKTWVFLRSASNSIPK